MEQTHGEIQIQSPVTDLLSLGLQLAMLNQLRHILTGDHYSLIQDDIIRDSKLLIKTT